LLHYLAVLCDNHLTALSRS